MATYSQRTTFTRELVLDHASRVLLESGIPNFRMRDLADSLGVTIPYIYKHFKSREEIVAEAHVFLMTTLLEREIAAFEPPKEAFKSPKDFFDHLRFIVRDPEGKMEETRRLRLQGLAAVLYDESAERKIAVLAGRHQDALANLIRFAQQTGTISESIDADLLAFIIISVRIGFILQDVRDGKQVTEDEVWGLYEAAFLLLQGS
jgi:AcrR family transcriptional regulator